MALVAVYDACVLHDPMLRDLLVRLAMRRQLNLRARWSERILEEMVRSIQRRRPDLDVDRLARTRTLMTEAIPDCLVTGYEHLVESLELPDPDDRHVLAAAIRAHAQVIVTFNLADFPAAQLQIHELEAVHPDDFVLGLIDLNEVSVVASFSEQIASLRSPPVSVSTALDALRTKGLPRTADALDTLLQ